MNEPTEFLIFPWSDELATGIALIDEQHRRLIDIINRLASSLAHRSSRAILDQTFGELVDYADYHFTAEGEIWRSFMAGDPWFEGHEQAHAAFFGKIAALQQNNAQLPFDEIVQQVISFLTQWLAAHILDGDRRMALAVLALQGGATLPAAKRQANRAMSGATKVLIDTVLRMYDSLSARSMELMREKSLRLQAEKALMESEERWRFLLEGKSENVWDWNIERSEFECSKARGDLFDIARNDIYDEESRQRIHPDDLERVMADLRAHLAGETEFYVNKHRVLRPSGGWSWILSRGKVVGRDEKGNALRMIGTHTDITERELAALIYRNSTQAMFVADVNDRIIAVNPAFETITGRAEAEVIGQGMGGLFSGPEDDALRREMGEGVARSGSWCGEVWNRRPDGEPYCISIKIDSANDESGAVDHRVGLFWDITEKKRAELALARQQAELERLVAERTAELVKARDQAEAATRAKGRFLANMSHEIRTPLNAILGFSELLAGDAAIPPPQRRSLAVIRRSGEHLLDMVNDVLDLSKIEADCLRLEPVEFDLPRLLEELAEMFEVRAASSGLRFERELDPALVRTVRADARKLRQVLINLLGNAAKFTRQGGFVLRARSETLCVDPPQALVHLEVEDSGVGIPPEQLATIFEAFFQSDRHSSDVRGTGLGLTISRSFVRLMGGEMRVESRDGRGSRFFVELPVQLGEGAELPAVAAPPPIPAGLAPGAPEWRILLAEDHEANRLLLRDLLAQVGFQVREAADGEAAVALFQEWRPHFIWMDIRMPRLDGRDATRRIRALPGGREVRIAALTASVLAAERDRILAAGCDAVVYKPYRFGELFDLMARLLGVRFRYDGSAEPAALAPPPSPESAGELPAEAWEALHEAAQRADPEAFDKALAGLGEGHAPLAARLRALADDFHFARIVALLAG